MQFIEMSGHTLLRVITPDGSAEALSKVGVKGSSIVRVNRQGDLEVHGPHGWEPHRRTAGRFRGPHQAQDRPGLGRAVRGAGSGGVPRRNRKLADRGEDQGRYKRLLLLELRQQQIPRHLRQPLGLRSSDARGAG